jgi:ketosteroid isomerase-like protein
MKSPLSTIVLKYLGAYETKNRNALEAVLSANFTFTSPVDDHIDRATYFERCWPNSEGRKSFRVEKIFTEGNECFVAYEGERTSGAKFKNTEFIRVENGQIAQIDVYFGPDQGDTPFPHVP